MINDDGTPKTVDFNVTQQSADNGTNAISVKASLLAMVPVPHLRIDSLTINFTFEISQTYRDSSTTDKSVEMNVASGRALSPWVKASEAPIPEGLARVLSLMTSAIVLCATLTCSKHESTPEMIASPVY